MKNSRKIEISLIVESNETLEVLAQDLRQEIACCWNTFEIIYIKEIYTNSNKKRARETRTQLFNTFIDMQETIDVVPVVRGKWLETHEVFGYLTCSECGMKWCIEDNDTETFKYCPNCGAKMDEEKTDGKERMA